MTNKRETREIGGLAEVRQAEGEDRPRIAGYAARYNSRSIPIQGLFFEYIEPGAFARALEREPDVRALIDHNPTAILGRTRAGTLRLAADDAGLAVDIDPPDTTAARDLIASMRRGDVSQMSFGFVARSDRWGEEEIDGQVWPVRWLVDVDLYDVSVVTFPAYPETEAGVRSCREYLRQAKRSRVPVRLLASHLALRERE